MESRHQERDRYLAKAKEAEVFAAKSIDPITRGDWQKIAEAYRRLTKYIQHVN